MRGMATLQTFEELPGKEPDSPDVRKHLHFCLHAKMYWNNICTTIFCFTKKKNNPPPQKKTLISCLFVCPLLQDEQSDSGMVLPSEELKHFSWNNGTMSRKLGRS